MHVRRRTAIVHLHSDNARTKQQVPVPAVKLGCVSPPQRWSWIKSSVHLILSLNRGYNSAVTGLCVTVDSTGFSTKYD